MTPLLSLLLNDLPPGLWHLDGFDPVRRHLVEAFGHRVVLIDIDPGASKLELLDLVADRLGFPHWFGRNWDALNDALFDLTTPYDTPSSIGHGDDLIVFRAVDNASEPTGNLEPGAAAATMFDIVAQVADEAGFCVVVAGIAAGRNPTDGSHG
ncbi:MAG: barstar family protein [Acidimicrobiia bacterium]|nr:barstar family protein [Acidimicrobiia bacterium]